ncbi:MAG: murein biosynthesis integral membrane protein MurJ [Pseudomonadota bacterium]|nr:murein biosynthesis integral membrane protein MurJ [Pseudomonadota bacterium]MDE3038611.1 murein biosynthesis integral membrane protein MurJ [Pseudomonadota bacterium]
MSLVKSTATIGGYTLLSRVLGFLRDVTIASTLGASFLSDAFFIAFKLPNFLRRLFAEGAFNSAFVPMFAGQLAVDGKEQARRFSSEAMSFLLLIVLIVTAIFILFMPYMMFLLAPGFESNPAKFALTVTLTRITMPYIIFISLVSLLGGILNSGDKFAAVAATPIIMNLCLIIIPFFIDRWTPTGAHGLAVAVMISGIAQWLWLVYFCRKMGVLPRLVRPRLSPDVKKLLLLIAPAALGAGVAQVNLFIDLIIASQFPSGVSYLYYADRISELPLAVIGIAVGTALLPMLSRQIREGRHAEAHHSQNRAIELSLFLCLPAAVALIVIAEPVITVMFQRGRFDAGDTVATFHALIAFAIGLPAFILVKIVSPAFYAHRDTRTPFKIAAFCVLVNLVFNLLLMGPLRHVGMALATSIASWVNVALMTMVLARRHWFIASRNLLTQIGRILLSSLVMALALQVGKGIADPYIHMGEITRFTALLALVLLGLSGYFLTGWLLNTMGLRTLARRWLNKLPVS